jgi:hypothetical protein
MVSGPALLITKPCIQVGFVRRARIGPCAEDLVAFVRTRVGGINLLSIVPRWKIGPTLKHGNDCRGIYNQSKILSRLDECEHDNNERNQELIHCFFLIF